MRTVRAIGRFSVFNIRTASIATELPVALSVAPVRHARNLADDVERISGAYWGSIKCAEKCVSFQL
jgi:hypothetical protein